MAVDTLSERQNEIVDLFEQSGCPTYTAHTPLGDIPVEGGRGSKGFALSFEEGSLVSAVTFQPQGEGEAQTFVTRDM